MWRLSFVPVALVIACSRAAAPPAPPATDAADACLDKVTVAAGLNPYGDPIGTVYAGGTPLFDEATGHSMTRFDYVMQHHPQLAAKCPKSP